jgi:hypothetical protein
LNRQDPIRTEDLIREQKKQQTADHGGVNANPPAHQSRGHQANDTKDEEAFGSHAEDSTALSKAS